MMQSDELCCRGRGVGSFRNSDEWPPRDARKGFARDGVLRKWWTEQRLGEEWSNNALKNRVQTGSQRGPKEVPKRSQRGSAGGRRRW